MKNDPSPNRAQPLDSLLHRAEDFARRDPARAAAAAFGAGFVLNFLPLGAIASAIVGIVFATLRPTLLILGLLRAFELFPGKTSTAPNHE